MLPGRWVVGWENRWWAVASSPTSMRLQVPSTLELHLSALKSVLKSGYLKAQDSEREEGKGLAGSQALSHSASSEAKRLNGNP